MRLNATSLLFLAVLVFVACLGFPGEGPDGRGKNHHVIKQTRRKLSSREIPTKPPSKTAVKRGDEKKRKEQKLLTDMLAKNCLWATSNRGALARHKMAKGEQCHGPSCCNDNCEKQYLQLCLDDGFDVSEYVRVVADLRCHTRGLSKEGRRTFFADRLDNAAYDLADAGAVFALGGGQDHAVAQAAGRG